MKKFPPIDRGEWNLTGAHKEVDAAAKWARNMGYVNLAPRLEWAAKLIKKELENGHDQ